MKAIDDIRNEVAATAIRFMKSGRDAVHILGTNKYGLAAAHLIESEGGHVAGFIDDRRAGEELHGFPIVSMENVPEGGALLNCIVEGRSVEARDNLLGRGPRIYCDYFALRLVRPNALPEVDFMGATDTIPADLSRYRWLHDRLADDTSRTTLEGLLHFRFNRDIRGLERFTYRLHEQYFETFVSLANDAVFVDGGGFDGGTVQEFHRRYPGHGTVHYFEPNAASMELSRQNLAVVPHVRFVPKGLWNEATILHFDASLGSASKVSEAGGASITTTALDLEPIERVDMIKLDIEGAELSALRGAEQLIRRHRPVLAVCVYHHQQDFWKVPEIVLGMVPDHAVYLRHYTQGVFETVMYFVPEGL
ncbi:MAG: FkbM family methyltransferase [Flavobacteriales bacterium]|nr:FkbM family methyltransferase [Flavobacteriales bacterium]